MSSFPSNPGQASHETNWAARLIPGAAFSNADGIIKKKNRSSLSRVHLPQTFLYPQPALSGGNLRTDSSYTRGARNVLIIGAGSLGRKIESYIKAHPEGNRSVCAFLDDRRPIGNGVAGNTDQLAQAARSFFVDEVILAEPHDQELTLRVLEQARNLQLDVTIASDLFGCDAIGSEHLGSIPLISLHQEEFPVTKLLFKRLLDFALSAAALLLLTPALVLIALIIKLDSRGPVLYSAARAGRKRRPFACHKFRTMVAEADHLKTDLRSKNQRSGPIFKIRNDPRITRVGNLLRRYSLDELPQLWNVIRGDMSLVGPRPHPLDDVSGYAIEHLPRLDVTPGLTGLWQVTARTNPSFQAGVDLDVAYIHSWSLGMDLRILWRTAGAVLRGSGE
jgi:exopolysaccharide biosynthesis polyprenyl glycosylphosphotransferase